MGQTWHAPAGAPRPAHRMGLYVSREGERCRAGHALVRHRRHGGAPHRDQCRRRSRRPCGADRRSGRLALDAQAGDHNITVLALPPRSPEWNPVENVAIPRQLVGTGSSNPTKTSSRCAAKPGTTSSPTMKIMSLGMRRWVLINDRWYYTRQPKLTAAPAGRPFGGLNSPWPNPVLPLPQFSLS